MEKETEKKEKLIDDVLIPELKEDDLKVTIGEIEITIKELPIFYTKQINRKLGPLYKVLSGGSKIEAEDLINLDKIEDFYDLLVEVSLIIITVHVKDSKSLKKVNKEYLEKNASERLLLELIHKQLQANGMLDFLERVLKGIMTVMGTFGTLNNQEKPENNNQNT